MTDRFIKLVRDRVVEPDDEAIYKRVGLIDEDFHWALKRKLIEEALEYQETGSWEELIDVFEVIWTLVEIHGKGFGQLKIDAKKVRIEKGSFLNRMALWVRRKDA